MPQYHMPDKEAPAYQALDTFTRSYIEAIFWTDNGPGTTTEQWQTPGYEPNEGSIPGDVGFLDLGPGARRHIVRECKEFQAKALALLNEAYEDHGYSEEQAGIDFWLTRNHHGAGYWDRTELEPGKLGDKLTKLAHSFGESDSYLGDDGKVYLT